MLQAVRQAQAEAAAAIPPPSVVTSSRAVAALCMRLPPLTAEVRQGITTCFELFSARSHPDLISDVSVS
jgi:hypothetical protein